MSIEVVYLQHYLVCYIAGATRRCCLSGRMLCIHHTTMHKFTVSLHAKSHTYDACVFSCNLPHDQHVTCVFSSNLPHALLAKWLGSLTWTAVTRGWNGYRNKGKHKKLTQENFFPPLLPGLNPRPLDHESDTLTTELRSPKGELCHQMILGLVNMYEIEIDTNLYSDT